MATIQHKSHDRTVAHIAERNSINPRTPGMMVLVRDAIGDPYAGSGRAVYRWDEVQASWILMFKDNVETLTFTGESKSISQDQIQLSFVPANGQVWDVMVRDGLVVHQVEYSVAGSVVTIYPNVPGEFDGQQLSVRYAYGSMAQQLTSSMDSHLKESNPHPQYALQQQLGTVLASYPVSLANNLQPGDHLEFDGSKWANTSKTTLVDGGNF